MVDLECAVGGRGTLSPDERSRVRRLRLPRLARRLERSHVALRQVLSRYVARPAEQLVFERGANGKPELVASDWRFNLSHSTDCAVVAVVRDARIGVDVESLDVQRRFWQVARRFFAADEYETFQQLPEAQQPHAFYRLWTRKEAYVKAWGTGLTFSSRRFSVALDERGGRLLLATEMSGDSPQRWWFEERSFGGRYLVTTCWEGEARRLRCWSYQPGGDRPR